ncbi:hypothetical protein IGB42_04146 [Andreprevotia sp. IGB-42]|uniref:hypothetical protein n=1 Tax=Andreprevotia sp. IGB-42 TaxID=2497473 RepID=UPI001359FE00|nr:hypothetical protein [Andreprevotia sp. IGB-42]KAF0811380.1 hypothetical protein IGB42_04146 [Andreprevotia sp. IGB-42]
MAVKILRSDGSVVKELPSRSRSDEGASARVRDAATQSAAVKDLKTALDRIEAERNAYKAQQPAQKIKVG